MKYSDLLTEITDYHARKGFWRRWFWDSKYISAMTQFMQQEALRHGNSATLPDLDLKYSAFQVFTQYTLGHRVNFFNLITDRASLSKKILINWFNRDILSFRPVSPTPLILNNISPLSFTSPAFNHVPAYTPPPSSIFSHYPELLPSARAPIDPLIPEVDPLYSSSFPPMPRSFLSGNRVIPESRSRFFVSGDGVVHDGLSTPPQISRTLPVIENLFAPLPILNHSRVVFIDMPEDRHNRHGAPAA
jgi:hypothetical protein